MRPVHRDGEGSRESRPSAAEPAHIDQKSYEVILEQEVDTALAELGRRRRGLLWSGVSAGLDIGFSALAVGVVVTLAEGVVAPPAFELLRAAAYGIGFVMVIFARSDLFTEHTTLAVLPLLAGRTTIARVARLWGLVYAGNLLGSWAFALVLSILGPEMGTITADALARIGTTLADHPPLVILLSAIVAGWLMGLVSWLVAAGTDTVSKIVFVWMVTGLIGFAELHHSIVGSVELAAAFLTGGVGLDDYARVMALATLGNAIGGVVFVAVVKYAHASVSSNG